MTTGEDSTRRAVDDGAALDAGRDADAPRRLPTFPYRGVNDTTEIPLASYRERMAAAHGLDTAEIDLATSRDDASPAAPDVTAFDEDDAADPVMADDAPAPPEDDAPTAHRHRSGGLMVTVAVMSVALLAAAAMIAYLWQVTEDWEAQFEELSGVSYGLGADLAAVRDALAEAESRIDLLNDQLSASKDTVSRLQAENAQWGDDAAFAQERIAGLETSLADATTVSNALTRCINGQTQLVSYLQDPDTINADDLEIFTGTVTELCTSALDAHRTLQQSAAP